MKKVFLGEVVDIKESYLLVSIDNTIHKCTKKNISDYNCDLKSMFTLNKKYQFVIIDNQNDNIYISYKIGRPKLFKNKKSPMPTISGFKNLSNNMHKHLKAYVI